MAMGIILLVCQTAFKLTNIHHGAANRIRWLARATYQLTNIRKLHEGPCSQTSPGPFRWYHNNFGSSELTGRCLCKGQMLYCHLQHHNDTIIKTQEDFFRKIFVPLTLFVRVRKGCVGVYCERELETKQNYNILTPTLMAVNVVSLSFSWCSTGGPLCWVMAFFTASYQQLLRTLTHQGPKAWCGFPYHISSITLSDL